MDHEQSFEGRWFVTFILFEPPLIFFKGFLFLLALELIENYSVGNNSKVIAEKVL